VKPEQASKVKSWTPTCLDIREGCTNREDTDTCTGWVHRGKGHGMQGRWCGRVGEPQSWGFRSRLGGRPGWDSERVIVPLKPGNAGGGKDPHFRVLAKEPRSGDWRYA
jgi:hypothetical protein